MVCIGALQDIDVGTVQQGVTLENKAQLLHTKALDGGTRVLVAEHFSFVHTTAKTEWQENSPHVKFAFLHNQERRCRKLPPQKQIVPA